MVRAWLLYEKNNNTTLYAYGFAYKTTVFNVVKSCVPHSHDNNVGTTRNNDNNNNVFNRVHKYFYDVKQH